MPMSTEMGISIDPREANRRKWQETDTWSTRRNGGYEVAFVAPQQKKSAEIEIPIFTNPDQELEDLTAARQAFNPNQSME